MSSSLWSAYALAYDGLGRLRTRNDNGTVVNYIYDGMRVIQERGRANGPQVSYTHDGWGHPIEYVPYDPARKCGVAITLGASKRATTVTPL